MQVVVITDKALKEELLATAPGAGAGIVWLEELAAVENYKGADAYIDLLFDSSHIPVLKKFLPKPVVINSVVETLADTDTSFVRINGWPTFLQSPTLEATALQDALRPAAEKIFSAFGKKIEWLPDGPGFVSPRVISMIINEAFIALGEGVSTVGEMDTAMKLGTSYPYGPFEWAAMIGIDKINALLQRLGQPVAPAVAG